MSAPGRARARRGADKSRVRRVPAPALIAAAVAVVAGCSPGAVQVPPPQPIGAVQERCAHLGDVLPARLESLHSRVVDPKSSLTHAWGDPPVVLRCGVALPAGYSPTSTETASVNDVSWVQQINRKTVTWTAIRPGANVALTVPKSYVAQGAFLTDLASALKRALP